MTLRSLVILCELEPDVEHYEPPTKLFNGSWGFSWGLSYLVIIAVCRSSEVVREARLGRAFHDSRVF